MRMSREVKPETAVARAGIARPNLAARIRSRPAGKAAPVAVGGTSKRLETTRPITVANLRARGGRRRMDSQFRGRVA